MTNISILNSEAHRDLRIRTEPSAKFGDATRFVPVVISELPLLVVHNPVFFSKDTETGAFYCGAMLGFDDGENLFLGKRAPADVYRPLNLQRGPFFTAQNEVAIDLDNPRVNSSQGEALFTANGTATPYLVSVIAALRELTAGAAATKTFIDTLLRHKLIEPITLDLAFDDGTRREVVGLYTVSQDTLQHQPDDIVIDLFRRGYLKLIYLLIASVRQVNVLAQAKNRALLDAA